MQESTLNPMRSKVGIANLLYRVLQSTCVYVHHCDYVVAQASAVVSINATEGEICFSTSVNDCYLANLTLYNVSIANYDGQVFFRDMTIPESSCVFVPEILQPDHRPFFMLIQPHNEFIDYRAITQIITSGKSNTLDTIIIII